MPNIFNPPVISGIRKRIGEKGAMSSYVADAPINLFIASNIVFVGAVTGWLIESGSLAPSLKETA